MPVKAKKTKKNPPLNPPREILMAPVGYQDVCTRLAVLLTAHRLERVASWQAVGVALDEAVAKYEAMRKGGA